ncbi:MAG: maleylpyruvate isomerase N-terminal domain-containing protein [Thermomicrobiales bacterium]
MPDRESLVHHYHMMREQLLAALDGLTTDQLTEQTLDGWSVNDHLSHLVFWDEMRAADIERISAGYESAWRMNERQVDVLNETAHSLRRDFSVDQVLWELERTRRLIETAIANATERGLEPEHYAEPGLISDHEAEHTHWILAWRKRMEY